MLDSHRSRTLMRISYMGFEPGLSLHTLKRRTIVILIRTIKTLKHMSEIVFKYCGLFIKDHI